jgi:cell wall-associated NlpC family hydrolase
LCHATIQFSIDKVGHPSETQTQWRHNADAVSDSGPGDLVFACVKIGKNGHTQEASMACHAPIPNSYDRKGIFAQECHAVSGQHVKQNVAQSTADKYAEHGKQRDKVANLFFCDHPEIFAG